MKITHTINWHINKHLLHQAKTFITPHWAPKDATYEYIVKFNKSCLYCDSEVNQKRMGDDCKDWNKLCGISYRPYLGARKNSVMVGWRHLPETQRIEVQPYLHHWKTGEPIYKDFQPRSLKLNTYYKITLSYDHITIQELKVTTEPSPQNGWKLEYEPSPEGVISAWGFVGAIKPTRIRRQINSYFGGNQTAPQDITFELDRGFVKTK
jgi:hypothetical protein